MWKWIKSWFQEDESEAPPAPKVRVIETPRHYNLREPAVLPSVKEMQTEAAHLARQALRKDYAISCHDTRCAAQKKHPCHNLDCKQHKQ
jgi:hypothetical protein